MRRVAEARALPGCGLGGDRPFEGWSAFSGSAGTELAGVEAEGVEVLAAEHALHLDPGEGRRTVDTRA